jgi:hypothetical protein
MFKLQEEEKTSTRVQHMQAMQADLVKFQVEQMTQKLEQKVDMLASQVEQIMNTVNKMAEMKSNTQVEHNARRKSTPCVLTAIDEQDFAGIKYN